MRILQQWATAKVRRQNANLVADLEAHDRTIKVMQAEIDSLALVVARDRERIMAEAAAYARQRAESEGVSNERFDQGVRQHVA